MSDVYVCSKFSNWLKLKVYILHWFKTFIFSSNMIGTGGIFFLLSKSCQLFAWNNTLQLEHVVSQYPPYPGNS